MTSERTPQLGRRISVVGTTGCGKTTTAGGLAERLKIPHVELDALYWGPDWVPVPQDIFRQRAALAAHGDEWVIDGNYSGVRDMVWRRADSVIWLDYALATVLWQLARRTIGRSIRREELWHGNRESLRRSFLSRDSILLWALRTYRRKRRDYPVLLRRPEHAHLSTIQLRSPAAAREWLSGLAPEEV